MSRLEQALLISTEEPQPGRSRSGVCLAFKPRALAHAAEPDVEPAEPPRDATPRRVQIRPGIRAADYRAVESTARTTTTGFTPVPPQAASAPPRHAPGRTKVQAPPAPRPPTVQSSQPAQPARSRETNPPAARPMPRPAAPRSAPRTGVPAWTPSPLSKDVARTEHPAAAAVVTETKEAPATPPVEQQHTVRAAPGDVAAAPAPVPSATPPTPPTETAAGETLPGFSWTTIPGRGRMDQIANAGSPAAVEQYRKLAGALLRAQEAHAVKIVMMASALPSEGKSLTSATLAMTLANSYRRNVLVIDADLRLSSLHQVFGVPNVAGLSDFLDRRQRTTVAPVEVVPGLTLLTAGRPTTDPVGGLNSTRMRELLVEASRRFDWVIIDTPPVTLLPDANLLTAMVDAVVMVIAAGETQYPFLTRAIEALGRDRILGTVLNRARSGVHLDSYTYSKGY